MLPSIGETANKPLDFDFNALSSYFNALYYLFHMALDRLSCCKCLLVYVTFYHTHWSVDCLELL